jgi:Predicted periplasmic solute-binding protein
MAKKGTMLRRSVLYWKRTMIKRAFIWGLLILGLAGVYMYWYAHTPLPLKQTPLEFDLKPGSNLATITSQMQAAGVMNDELRFRVLARMMGKAGKNQGGFLYA